MREEDTYLDIANRFVRAIKGLHPDWSVAFSQNKFLPSMITDLENELEGESDYHSSYVPNLKLDILIGVKKESENPHISLVLLEVKVETLTLNHQAQLMGYLIAAPKIKCGILFCAALPNARQRQVSFVSSELSTLLNLRALPASFSYSSVDPQVTSNFRIGIAYCQYQAMIQWRPNQASQAISSFQSLTEYIESI